MKKLFVEAEWGYSRFKEFNSVAGHMLQLITNNLNLDKLLLNSVNIKFMESINQYKVGYNKNKTNLFISKSFDFDSFHQLDQERQKKVLLDEIVNILIYHHIETGIIETELKAAYDKIVYDKYNWTERVWKLEKEINGDFQSCQIVFNYDEEIRLLRHFVYYKDSNNRLDKIPFLNSIRDFHILDEYLIKWTKNEIHFIYRKIKDYKIIVNLETKEVKWYGKNSPCIEEINP